ncbi:hypothetical protein [Actinacidiphila glaucinigra]|uniref:Uncharacterized protein n=1 Tax=Actinacidiphila glaucinigra TaxID=235986 RepID=A0A239CGZ6_9ACTN|nr:hypothetical protein [Actinacidiphila glaucinigra]SNS18961.1 hypothetical protein SAMN05216252_1045 [Actinacidiphila glaucinigra]
MLIKGYDHGPLTAGETLTDRPGFWANHLLGWCQAGPDGARPEPEWFGDDGADTDALAEVLYDGRAWPVLRVPFGGGHCAAAVFRNLDGDPGLDFLLTHPGWTRAETLLSYDGDRCGPGLRWRQLLHVAASVPDAGPGHGPDEGLSDPAARLLLLLPLLTDGPRHAAEAVPRIASALTAVGAPGETAALAARCLIGGTQDGIWHEPTWRSPLSGGGSRSGEAAGRPVSWPSPGLGLTAAEQERLARALGRDGEPSAGVSARST